MKNIAVLTSGGDSPGMNAAVRAVVRTALYNDIDVYGVKYGYRGLVENQIEKLDVGSVADTIQRGGTFIHTARCPEMMSEEGLQKAVETLKLWEIDGLICIGGDGTFKGALELSKRGINVVGVPATIDNDVASSDYSIGFDTAINTVIDAISKIRDTSLSHSRINVVEVMGRHSGNIALHSGFAGGADAITVPEIAHNIDDIAEKILKSKCRGKLHSIIVFAEGCGDVQAFCTELEEKTKFRVRMTNLGYIQRGGSPTAFDRILAANMGSCAVYCLLGGKFNRVIGHKNNQYIDFDIAEAVNMEYKLNMNMYKLAMELSI